MARPLLVVAPDVDLRHAVEESLLDMPVDVMSVRTEDEARRALAEFHPEIAIISDGLPDDGSVELCRAIRSVHLREPFQIVLAVTQVVPGLLERAINGLIDDFYITSAPAVELKLRVQAALRRIADHGRIADEREYYRKAARQEEELTSRVLDETLELRDQYNALQEESPVDPASRLRRRAALLAGLDMEVERALRSLNTLSGFLVAPDRAQPLRQTHGLEGADRLFVQLGRIFLDGLRKYDICGLLSEDAVFVGLPGTDLVRATAVADRVALALAGLSTQAASLAGAVTFSFGVAEFRDGEARDHWIRRAQDALERARALGGGRVETVESLPDAYHAWKATRRK